MRESSQCTNFLPAGVSAWCLAFFLSVGAVQAAPHAAPVPTLAENTKFRIWLRGEPVLMLRQMLAVVGLKAAPDTVAERYDLGLVGKVREFQRREKLADTGLPRAVTIAHLNRAVARTLAAQGASPGEPAAPGAAATAPAAAAAKDPVAPPPAAPARAPAASGAPPNAPTASATAATNAPPAGQANAVAKTPAMVDKPLTSTPKTAAKPSVSCPPPASAKALPEMPMLDRQSLLRQRDAIARYEKIAAAGGFPVVQKPPKLGYCLGQDHPAVGTAIERLIADGYLPASYRGTTAYTQAVVDAVKQFQDTQGFAPSGQIGSDTRTAMNVPVEERLAAMRTSLQRMEKVFSRGEWSADQLRVLVNLPSASVQVIGGDELLAGYKAIVGRDERQSPEFVATIPDIQLVPSWHVPPSIVARDIAKRVHADPRYLEKNHMRALRGGRPIEASRVNWRAGPFPEVEQRPGPHNALGLMRFGTTNRGAYFLHGTSDPDKVNQSRSKRFLSSGCVRLADPALLASLILRGTPASDGSPWTLEKLRAQIGAPKTGWEPGPRIRLAKPIPLIWTYLTGWVSRDGRVHFRPDSYERQEEVETAINR